MTPSLIDTPGTLRPMLRLALPVLLEQFLSMLVVFSDTALAGRYLQQEHLAAMTVLAYVMWLLPSLFAFVAIGATAMVARFVGARDAATARHVTNQAVLLGVGITLAVSLLLWLLGAQLIALLNLRGGGAHWAERYLGYLLPVLPAIMLTQIGPACLRGAGDTVSGLVAMAVVNVLNVAVSWSLVHPGLADARAAVGIPELGFDGLPIGTAIGLAVGGLIMAWLLLRGRYGLKLEWKLLRFNADLCRRLLRIGVPGGFDLLAVICCHLWFVGIVFDLGEIAGAAHGVAVRIESLAYLPGTAFQVAATTLAGQYLGARDYRRAGRSVLMACLVGGVVMTGAGLLFFFGGGWLVGVLVKPDKAEVMLVATRLLRVVAPAIPALALTMILSGALRGAGDTRWPFAFTIVGMLGVRIPGAYLLTGYWTLGVDGAWYAMVVDLFLRCLLVAYRFRHGGWQRIEV